MADHDHETDETLQINRQTAPQGPYTMRDVGIGAVVAIVGMILVFGLPVLATA